MALDRSHRSHLAHHVTAGVPCQQQPPLAAEGTTVGVAGARHRDTHAPNGGMVPQQGGPLHPGTQTGLDVVAEDGVSTKTVEAVPCTTAARETDGTTTCVGIPS